MKNGDVQGIAKEAHDRGKDDLPPIALIASHRRGEAADDAPATQIDDQRVLTVKTGIRQVTQASKIRVWPRREASCGRIDPQAHGHSWRGFGFHHLPEAISGCCKDFFRVGCYGEVCACYKIGLAQGGLHSVIHKRLLTRYAHPQLSQAPDQQQRRLFADWASLLEHRSLMGMIKRSRCPLAENVRYAFRFS